MAVYAAAPQFEEIQAQLSGFFISVLTSQEGSTGKTEVIKMMNSLFGMPNKAMCASASEAGLYELIGNLLVQFPYVLMISSGIQRQRRGSWTRQSRVFMMQWFG